VNTISCDIQPVKSIPGDLVGVRTIDLNVRSYAGFTHDHQNHDHMFGWFYEAQPCMGDDEVANFPLVLWFNGGPGASSMFGAMTENGPYLIQESGLVVENPHAWNQEAHIMYWDNPGGAGYSYNDDNADGGGYVTDEEAVGKRMYRALQTFFQDERYAKYKDCPMYVTGESYGGKYIPAICNTIREKASDPDPGDVAINLAGMAIGNPYMDPHLQCVKRIECGHTLGFLDTMQYELLLENAQRMKDALDKDPPDYVTAFNYNQGIKKDLIACGGNIAIYDVRVWDVDPLGPLVEGYFRLNAVRKALHVPKDQPWNCADETGPVTENLLEDFVTNSSQKSLRPLLAWKPDDAFRVLIYTGNLDMSCGIAGTEKMLQNLDWEHDDKWRYDPKKKQEDNLQREVWASPRTTRPKPPEHRYSIVPGKTKGFIKSCANLTQIVIPCAGHMVPSCQPEVCFEMINTFIHGRTFPSYKTPIADKYPDELKD